jgi:hypothetical protein
MRAIPAAVRITGSNGRSQAMLQTRCQIALASNASSAESTQSWRGPRKATLRPWIAQSATNAGTNKKMLGGAGEHSLRLKRRT